MPQFTLCVFIVLLYPSPTCLHSYISSFSLQQLHAIASWTCSDFRGNSPVEFTNHELNMYIFLDTSCLFVKPFQKKKSLFVKHINFPGPTMRTYWQPFCSIILRFLINSSVVESSCFSHQSLFCSFLWSGYPVTSIMKTQL